MLHLKTIAVMIVLGIFSQVSLAGDPLVVHEWGTFTMLQDENGNSIGGVNINEEPLPAFVDRLSQDLVTDANPHNVLLGKNIDVIRERGSKGIERYYPIVTMRMETPIIYFYPPEGAKLPLNLDVHVGFKGGWITEWYPEASNVSPGWSAKRGGHQSHLTRNTVGTIKWRNLKVGTSGTPPKTNEAVWLAPRKVEAANVTTTNGESEKYLFYRGVAALDSPVRVIRNDKSNELIIRGNFAHYQVSGDLPLSGIYLVDVRKNSTAAFRKLDNAVLKNGNHDGVIAKVPAEFKEEDYSIDNFKKLRDQMHQSIMDDGLYADESNALLNTWKSSYFTTPGLRLFYLLPEKWTNQVLPLTVSQPSKMERVMVGRIELIKPEQRAMIRKIAETKNTSNPGWLTSQLNAMPEAKRNAKMNSINHGYENLKRLGFDVPDDYQAFIEIGRFREALLIDEHIQRPNEGLARFIKHYHLPIRRAQEEHAARNARASSLKGK